MINEYLDRYADLLVSYALNVQPGQYVLLQGETCHHDLCIRMARIAYRRGAKYVQIDLQPVELVRERLEFSNPDYLTFVPKNIIERYSEMVDEEAAVLRLIGSEDPDILAHLDPKKVNMAQLAFRKSIKRYYEEGVGKSKVAWTVAAHATEAWGLKLFPELEPQEALEKLWEQIFKICHVDKENYLEIWKEHNQKLKDRARKLDNLKIKTLHFKGPGTDLKVGLSPLAQFRGGGDFSSRGKLFEPNIPTEECFTTPDYHATEGYVRVTRPVFVNGKLVEGLKLVFKKGEIVEVTADQGEHSFKEYISSDEGAKRLGEVALVGTDSPIYKSGHVFQEILYDENAACHIAVGFAYLFCLKDGDKLSPEEKEKVGCNVSSCHLDVMISDEHVDVDAIGQEGIITPIIRQGKFVT